MPKILTCPICGEVVRTKINAETCGLNYCRVTHYRRKKAKADNRGQSGIVAFLVAFIMSPILMGLIVLCRPNFKREEIEAKRHAELLEAARKGGAQ